MRTALKINLILWLVIILIIKLSTGAFAQSQRNPCYYPNDYPNPGCVSVGKSTPLPVVGSTGGYEFAVSNTPTVQNAAYSSGNAIGGLQTLTVFRVSGGTGILNNISIWSKGGSTTAITLYIFNSNPSGSTCTDKSAFSLAAADVSKLIATTPPVLTPAVVGAGTTDTVASQQLPISMVNGEISQSLYVCAVVGGAVTPASVSDLIFKFAGVLD